MIKTFTKVFGASGPQNQLVTINPHRYLVIYGYGEENGNGYNWRKEYDHKPTLSELRDDIFALINEQTQEAIKTGLRIDGRIVWLDENNQRNYAATAALVAAHRAMFPVHVKVGTYDDPSYLSFDSEDGFLGFAEKVNGHITYCVEEAWREKEEIDWTRYDVQ